MGVSSVQSAPPSPPPPAPSAPSAPAQSGSTSPGIDPAAPPAKSFKQVLDDQSAKGDKTNPDQPAAAAVPGKKNGDAQKSDSSEASADSAKSTGTPGAQDVQPAAEKATASAAAVNVLTKAKPKTADAEKTTAGTEDDAAPQQESVDAEKVVALDAESDSESGGQKQLATPKSKDKTVAVTTPTTDLTTAAAIAAAAEPHPAAAGNTVKVTDGGDKAASVTGATDKPQKTNASAGASKGSQLRAEQEVQPARTKTDKTSDSAKAATPDSGTDVVAANDAPGVSDAAATAPTASKTADHSSADSDFAAVQQQASDAAAQKTVEAPRTAPPQPAAPALPAQAQFAAANTSQIVNAVHTQLLPNGGSMHIRLDPPELGALQINVRMQNGLMTAEFQASSDQAAKLLSHSLGDLKSQLESQGVSVEKLQVTQAPRSSSGSSSDSSDSSRRDQTPSEEQRRDQQRKQMLQRMWSKLTGEPVPLDMVA